MTPSNYVLLTVEAFPQCQVGRVSRDCRNDVTTVTYQTNLAITVSQLDLAKTKSRNVQSRTPNFMRQTVIVAPIP